MVNNSCDLCNARTSYDYNPQDYSTVVKAHWVIIGSVVCDTCVDEIISATHRQVRKGRKHIRTESVKRTPEYTKGDRIKK